MMRCPAADALALLALSLASCNTGSEDRALFLAPPEMEHTVGRAGARGSGEWPVAKWWRQFRSDELNDLITAALEDNHCQFRFQHDSESCSRPSHAARHRSPVL